MIGRLNKIQVQRSRDAYIKSGKECKSQERRLRSLPKHGQQLQHDGVLICGGNCIIGPIIGIGNCGTGIGCCGISIWRLWLQHIGDGCTAIGCVIRMNNVHCATAILATSAEMSLKDVERKSYELSWEGNEEVVRAGGNCSSSLVSLFNVMISQNEVVV
uniref:Uncharacterized protein n=1 Tax=Elaeophora elaphi TaxID=1147741 RepID=A0A0R3RGN0_9BILA